MNGRPQFKNFSGTAGEEKKSNAVRFGESEDLQRVCWTGRGVLSVRGEGAGLKQWVRKKGWPCLGEGLKKVRGPINGREKTGNIPLCQRWWEMAERGTLFGK